MKKKNKTTMIKHKLNERTLKEDKEFKFYCSYCDFITFSKDTLEIHNNTDKHKKYKFINLSHLKLTSL